MTDTFRALCAELVELDQAEPGDYANWRQTWNAAIARACAALEAQPKPQGPTPTDEELDELFTEIDQSGEALSWRAYARAVLTRYGRPAIEPVPVSKRLPGRKDCNAKGRCWLTSVDEEPGWVAEHPELCTNWTHWLPYWALPVPGVEGADA